MNPAPRPRLPLLAAVAAAWLALAGAAPHTAAYVVDSKASSVSAKVGFLGLGSKTAGFPQMSGKVLLEPDRPNRIALDVTLDARALTAPDKVTLERLRGEKFFCVERYPTVRFVGEKMALTSDRKGTISGELTARGVTRPVTLAVSFDKPPLAAAPGEAITLTGTTTIDRRKFGMTAYSLVVGKQVTITLKARMVPD
ncbi:MAG: YceI family protein [Sphingomonadaceae bacterium]|nr:YceI family protein [Sphingomonadaceae bacterium]